MTTTTIKAGYKQTEIGVIPEDWAVESIGTYFDFKNGLNKEKSFFGKGTPIINYMDVYNHKGLRKKDIKGKVTLSLIELNAYRVKKGDMFFTRTSETVEEIGMASVLLEDIPKGSFSGFVLRARPKNKFLDDKFKKYCFHSDLVRKEISSKSSYTTRALTNGKLLSAVKFPVPTPSEQKLIATTLSDTDELISSLDALIHKKRMIKEGAMQELLTGKKRLAGFSGEWEVKKLGKMCKNITTGKLDANAMIENGKYRFYTCAKEHYFINNYAFDTEALLVSGNGANVGYVHYYKGKFNAYQRTYVLFDFSENVHFIKVFMDRNLQERIRVEVNAGNTPYITMDTLTEMEIRIPSTIEEQQAIAKILSDMDTEITTLEQKRDKYKLIKQGMMQQLLTGKIRLI